MSRIRKFGVAAAAIGLVFTFAIPWIVPVGTTPLDSDSWAVGFSNRFAILAIWAVGATLMGLGFFAGLSPVTIIRPRCDKSKGPAIWALVLLLILVVAETFLHATSGFLIGDSAFHIDRAAYVLGGATPYTQVEYPYGPGMLWMVVAGLKAALALHVAPAFGYYAVFLTFSVIGIALLYHVVDRLTLTPGLKTAGLLIGGILSIMLLAFFGNLQYTLVRFVAPFAALIALDDAMTGATARTTWRDMVWAACLSAATLAVSPEIGLAYCASGLLVIGIRAARDRSLLPILAGHFAGIVGLFAVTGPALLRSITMFGGGGGNLPVLPGPSQLLLVACLWFVAWYALSATRDITSVSAFSLGFASLCALMAVAAFGRADFFHVLLNGLIAVYAATAIVSQQRHGRLRATAVVAALGTCVVLAFATNPYWFRTYPTLRWTSSLFRMGVVSKAEARDIVTTAGMQRRDAVGYVDVFPYAGNLDYAKGWSYKHRLLAPLGFEDGLGVVLASRGLLEPDFFHRAVDITNDRHWAIKRAELSRADYIIVPTSALMGANPARPLLTRSTSIETFQLPIGIRYRHLPTNYDVMLLEAVRTQFEPVDTLGGYTIMRHR